MHLSLFVLVGCSANTNIEDIGEPVKQSFFLGITDENDNSVLTKELKQTISEEPSGDSAVQVSNIDSNSSSSGEGDGHKTVKEDEEPLSLYTSEQIEYARIWSQFGANQQVDELNVLHIKAGTPLNAADESSASYPEDVIQLAGSRLVDGSVTYSSNRNGTINVYNVPLRWDGISPAGEQFYKDIVNNMKLVPVAPGNDDLIIALINKLQDE